MCCAAAPDKATAARDRPVGVTRMDEPYSTATHTSETLEVGPARAPFGYYGAKQRIARRIMEALPPHNAWVEGFCGSAALTLAKPPAPIEVINDADNQIVNLFEQLRCNGDAVCRAVALTPYAREEYGICSMTRVAARPVPRSVSSVWAPSPEC